MVNLNCAYTTKINPSGATPILRPDQIWTGLQRKIRFAHEFVPSIESCKVLEDKDGVVTRQVELKRGTPIHIGKEVVTSYERAWIDFKQDDNTVIRNIVSEGPTRGLIDLSMTYTFEFKFPDIHEGSPEATEKLGQLKNMCKYAVEYSIIRIRDMVNEGMIKD